MRIISIYGLEGKISKRIVMLGATGEVGNHTALKLSEISSLEQLTLLGRRGVDNIDAPHISQQKIDIFNPSSYQNWVVGHDSAICTLGVGEPSKMDREEFLKIDKFAVLDFAKVCKSQGIKYFTLLSAVAVTASSRNYYLRAKGELETEIRALNFEKLSFFHPSMIMTPTNRYGVSQGLFLKVLPLVDLILWGPFKKHRSINSKHLGEAIALNSTEKLSKNSDETLHWMEFMDLLR